MRGKRSAELVLMSPTKVARVMPTPGTGGPTASGSSGHAATRFAAQPTNATTAMALPDLPLEILEIIGRSLELKDRVVLTSTCRTLWIREDLSESELLWGDLLFLCPSVSTPAKEAALSAWLARRRGALRRLRLYFSAHTGSSAARASPAALVGALATSPRLHELQLSSIPPPSANVEATLQPLAELTALTQLDLSCGSLAAVPPQLARLQSLAALSLANNWQLGQGGESAFDALRHLSSLTRLDLSWCRLEGVPPALADATALADLRLSKNPVLGHGIGQGRFAPLRALTGLTRLTLSRCGLHRLPSELEGLESLQCLILSDNWCLGRGGEGTFDALCGLPGLKRLEMADCSLRELPLELTCLQALEDLDLKVNLSLGQGGEAAFSPLRALSMLTSLNLSHCHLGAVPAAVSTLTRLAVLRLSGSVFAREGAGSFQGAFQALHALRALRRLDVSRCVCNEQELAKLAQALGAAGVAVEV